MSVAGKGTISDFSNNDLLKCDAHNVHSDFFMKVQEM